MSLTRRDVHVTNTARIHLLKALMSKDVEGLTSQVVDLPSLQLENYTGCMLHSRYKAVAIRAARWERQRVQQEQCRVQITAIPTKRGRWLGQDHLLIGNAGVVAAALSNSAVGGSSVT
jgi:hypothetical protein